MLDSSLTGSQRAELLTRIRDDAEACDWFVDHVLLHATLRKELGAYRPVTLSESLFHGSPRRNVQLAGRRAPQSRHRRPRAGRWRDAGLSLAFLVLGIAIAYLGTGFVDREDSKQPPPGGASRGHVAELISSTDALWAGPLVPDGDGWLPAGSIQLRKGQVEIQFVSGAVIALKAPAEFEAISPFEAKLTYGAMSARVDGDKTTFRIHTPTAEVIDLGTEFGLAVDRSGVTDVAVFDGIVDVSSKHAGVPIRSPATTDAAELGARVDAARELPAALAPAASAMLRRLTAGEALRVDWHGHFRRIATVTDDSFPPLAHPQVEEASPQPLITSVSDNLRDEDDPKFYRIVSGGFGEDTRAYVDRKYEWNGSDESGIPEFLLGADYIMTFNNDKKADIEITVGLSRPAVLFVLMDDERRLPPKWLKQSFVPTGLRVGMDEDQGPPTKSASDDELDVGPGVSIDTDFSVWGRRVESPGPVVLGPRGPLNEGRQGGGSMYGIAAVPLEELADVPLHEDQPAKQDLPTHPTGFVPVDRGFDN